jgi:hypothetical protein
LPLAGVSAIYIKTCLLFVIGGPGMDWVDWSVSRASGKTFNFEVFVRNNRHFKKKTCGIYPDFSRCDFNRTQRCVNDDDINYDNDDDIMMITITMMAMITITTMTMTMTMTMITIMTMIALARVHTQAHRISARRVRIFFREFLRGQAVPTPVNKSAKCMAPEPAAK